VAGVLYPQQVDMVRKKKIRAFQEAMLAWYDKEGRKFPWREGGLTSFQFVLTEILLQRTKAETINKFYPIFFSCYQSWEEIIASGQEHLEEVLRPIGLFRQRASRLYKLALEMLKRKGIFPNDRVELEAIPFMGQYIANAVEVFLFNIPAPLLDVNMARVLERVFKARTLSDIRYDPYLQQLAQKIVDHPRLQEINWAILDHAALVCTIRLPKCAKCPVNSICNYWKSSNKR
jgi:A/G-specific adenine glycosylase